MSKEVKNLNPFDFRNPVTPPIFAARRSELDKIKVALVENNESLSISGSFGIGKSSLILTALEKFYYEDSSAFIIQITDGQLYEIITGDFLKTLTHEICASIWVNVFKRKYSELLEESLHYPRNTDVSHSHEKTIKRIFRVVTSENIASSGKKDSTISAKLIAEARSNEINSLSMVRNPLMPFEFLLLLDEIVDVLNDFGFLKIIVTCDQLNHLPPLANYELVSQNFDVLSSKKISFIVSAENDKNTHNYERKVDTEILLKSFSSWITLSGFLNGEEIKEYVSNCLVAHSIKGVDFSEGIYDLIFSVCEGNPVFVSRMLYLVYQDKVKNSSSSVQLADFEKYSVSFAKAVTAYNAAEGRLPRYKLLEMIENC